jgi:ATP-binding cassette subfamily B protein
LAQIDHLSPTEHLARYADRPLAYFAHYIRLRPVPHAAILSAVVAAVICSVSTQYGVKFLVDVLSMGHNSAVSVWIPFAVLVSLIAADNFLWRLASWIASYTFVRVTGDLRRDLFRHLTGHAPSYFANRLPGMLTSRVTATSNAVFTVENMFVWNVLPPCIATAGAIAFLLSVSIPMAAGLSLIAAILVWTMFRLAAAGRPLHHDFADKAAAVDGEMVDVIGNMPLVRAFGGLGREYRRFHDTVDREMTARRSSLLYLEKVRLFHAAITVALTIALVAWAVVLWLNGQATTGEVVLVCTLGMSILHATRDLAVALVDVTQHMARLSEALATLLVPHELRDHPAATTLIRRGAAVTFEHIGFSYPDGSRVFEDFALRLEPGQRVGLVGPSGSGKSSLFALIQRFYDLQSGRILIDGQDIAMVTQESLRAAIAVVPQDISLFHRSIMENIRYGRQDASDEDVAAAAISARCINFIDALPEGMSTIVGDRGLKLSGGQRQRIAIARAFLKDAPILLLDEATSALDSESEEEIRQALDRLMRGRTVIAIAHRLSTLRSFDRIIVMQAGRIAQDGPPDKLMRRNGLYRDLIEREVTRLRRVA